MAKSKQTEGSFGAPPPGAPHEVAQPISAEAERAMLAAARANEKELAPFNPQPFNPPPIPLSPSVTPVIEMSDTTEELLPSPPGSLILHDEPVGAPPPQKRPAESDTDSPSRGIPRQILDPGKQITGGFGNLGEQQYFPMDGSELKVLVQKLLQDVRDRIENDLRFSIALTYPRVSARVIVEIDGYNMDKGFTVERIGADERTAIEVAKANADKVCFVVQEFRREFDEQNEPENPPDRMRDELGLDKPRKQYIQSGAARILVDKPSDLGGSF